MQKMKNLLRENLPLARNEWQRLLAKVHAQDLSSDRRRALKSLAAVIAVVAGGQLLFRDNHDDNIPTLATLDRPNPVPETLLEESDVPREQEVMMAGIDETLEIKDESVKDYLYKMRNFNASHDEDHFLSSAEQALLQQTVARLRRVQGFIGHANFNLLSFDKLCYYARNYSTIGAFSAAEQELMERFFYTDARELGFFGDKVMDKLTLGINKGDTLKVAGSGNYLFKGKPQEVFKKIQRESKRDDVILTSGVRGVVKQMHLFMEKAINAEGNLSLASRSLAPPGYSYHGISDFDVGQRGLGYQNFTAAFAHSDVYKRLSERGYLTMRYPLDNMLGVRYEPWHVKVG